MDRGRILALDFGARRIGLAVSDPLGVSAQGLPTLHRKNKRSDLQHLSEVVSQYKVCEIVVGLPLPLSGTPGAQAEKVRTFAGDLRKQFSLPVHLWDERLTSAQANRLLRETEMSIRRRGQVVDQMSAVLILQSFLDHRHYQ
ncbi:MAG TPA: Holliday junction resolvase RuvX [Terriglobales bacterium]|nr:Holliday junction resolvase RuvX [Terriglobales bacterium]